MRYSVPVNAACEVKRLAAAGASELYCGYLDAWWAKRYGDHDSASRRQGSANLGTPQELAEAVTAARACGLPIHLALNVRYTEPQLDHLVSLCDFFWESGGTGVILSDLGLLWRLRQSGLAGAGGLDLTLSILAVAQNVPTLQAYGKLGVSRVVLPRFMRPAEVARLLAGVPGMQASVMSFFDKCPYVDGYCRHRHGVSFADRASTEEAPKLPTFDTTYRTHFCLKAGSGLVDPFPCAACHLREFQEAGVETAKIGGRGRPLEDRLRALRFLRKAERLSHDEDRRKLYRATFGRDCACYYGTRAQRRSAIEPVEVPLRGSGRTYAGSQTDVDAFWQDLQGLCQGSLAVSGGVTLLVPPLSDEELATFACRLPVLEACAATDLRVAANDLGTLTLVAESALRPTLGTLLARLDDPHEVAHFLSPQQNPPRSVWDGQGRPRTLTYAPPPDALVRHWASPSACEPSAQQALAYLCGQELVAYEFDTSTS